MSDVERPAAPVGLLSGGSGLWVQVLDEYDLGPHELRILEDLCRQVDTVDVLQAAVDRDGPVIEGATGVQKVHPAAIEARQGRIVVARLAAALRLPVDDEGQGDGRGQRRGAPRGVYGAGAYIPQAERA